MKHATPDWNRIDYEMCSMYDERVARGEMSYRRVPVE